uniref:Phosphodiesterase I n=1 Tax=Angiostrongylus cantonensis TaxID=6313 RepID=A0A158P6Y3_ANGCA
MSSDIRVVPFTDEEKARLNEKVQKMRFSRPPPKLPTQLKRLFLKAAPSQAISLPQTSAQVGRSLNDASSIQLDEINNHCSLSSDIVLDGEEKEGGSLVDSVENNEDFNHLESSHVLIAACNSVTVNNSSNHPVEIINSRSPVVYSQQLLSTLSRNRGDLLGIALRAEEKIGKFENPTYGRLLLTKNFPVESMKYIMNSAVRNLTAYFNNRKPKPVRVVVKSKSDESPSLSDTSVRNENSSRMEDMERVEPEVNGIKLVRSRKRKGDNKASNKTVVNAKSMKSSAQINSEHQQAIRNMKKKRKRNLSIVSTTSDGPKKSFKIVIRRDAPTEVANPLLARIIAATNGSENGSVHNGQRSSSFILEDRMGDHRPQHSETNTIAGTSTLVTGNRAFKEESVDEDVVIVHENIRCTPQILIYIKIKPISMPLDRVTPEERSLVAQLAALIEVESVNTDQCNWFDELLGKARQFARHIDHHIEILMNSKLEMTRVRLKQMGEHTRYQSLLQERRSATACRDDLSNVPDGVAPELLSQCSQISPDVSYLSLKDDFVIVELIGVRGRRRCLRRAGNVQAIGPGDGRHCTPIVSNASQQVESLVQRRDPISLKDTGEIKKVS